MAKLEASKGSRVWEVIKKDYPAERILMGILGVIVIVFGVYLIMGVASPATGWLVVQNRDEWWLSWAFGTNTRVLIFSWVIIAVGVLSLAMAVWPFIQPSLAEMKKVSWPKGKTIQNHSARVYGFILFLIGMFLLYEIVLSQFFNWLRSL